MTVKKAMFEYLDNQCASLLSGWFLYDTMLMITGRHTYPQTLIKYGKEYADMAGASFDCIDKQRSIYHYVPGFKISGALEGRE